MAEKAEAVKNIIFTGGGTGGPVTPLLAVAEELRREDESGRLRLFFIGTKTGPEREMAAAFSREIAPLEFIGIPSGKWRRYVSIHNLFDLFKVGAGFFRAYIILGRLRPAVVVSAGAFVSVPLVWAAALRRIPVIIHQQDVRPGLANRLMAPFARVITVAFEKSLLDYGSRAVLIGNPVRRIDREEGRKVWSELKDRFGLRDDLPTVLVTGGRMGAKMLNELIFKSRIAMSFCQVIHLTGDSKLPADPAVSNPDYHVFESLTHQETLAVMEIAQVIVARCGLATLTELSALNKAAILIPIPHSHQEENAAVFAKNQAAVVLDQDSLTPEKLVGELSGLIKDGKRRKMIGDNAAKVIKRGAAETLAGIIWEAIK